MLEEARRQSARSINAILTATYWEIGRRIVEYLQSGESRAGYGEGILHRLSADLTKEFGRGYSIRNLRSFRNFYLGWRIRQTPSAELQMVETASGKFLSPQKCQTRRICHASLRDSVA